MFLKKIIKKKKNILKPDFKICDNLNKNKFKIEKKDYVF